VEYRVDDFYRTLVERSPMMITVVGADGTPLWSSPAARPVLASGAALDTLREALDVGFEGPVELRLTDADGRTRVLSLVAQDLRNDPAVRGTAFFGTDVTRARAAELRERVDAARMTALIESLHVGVLLQDEQQRVVLANSAFVELFALGLSASGFTHAFADQEAAAERIADTVRRGRPTVGDEIVLADGRILERDYVPVTLDGATLGHLWVFRDVTAQTEIRRGLETRNRVLTELSSLKTEFVRVVSHELRTPLTSIATFASMLDSNTDGTEWQDAVAAIRRNASRMLALVADLLLLAKLESGEIVLAKDPVDLAALVREACADRSVPSQVAAGPPVEADEPLLRQLFDTAIGLVVAAGEADAASGETAKVVATATGACWTVEAAAPTSEPTTAERLLSTRLPHPDTEGQYRTGALALMLAREIAARHGGQLSMSAEPPGVRVTVRLPVRGHAAAS
jgi:signal transduction histidine kinase